MGSRHDGGVYRLQVAQCIGDDIPAIYVKTDVLYFSRWYRPFLHFLRTTLKKPFILLTGHSAWAPYHVAGSAGCARRAS